MAKGEGLVYYKWYFDKSRELEGFVNDGLLTLEQAAEIFFAVQAYAEKGEVREMSSPALRMTYKSLCTDADRAKQAYGQKVEKLQDSGKKGGKAKASNAAAKATESPPAPQQSPQKFKPPTLTQFKNAVDHFNENEWDDEAEYSDYDVEALYDELSENGWIWMGRYHIQSRHDWEMLLSYRFGPYKTGGCTDWKILNELSKKICSVFTMGELISIADDFTLSWGSWGSDDGKEYYKLDGQTYHEPFKAIDAFIKSRYGDSQERSGPT